MKNHAIIGKKRKKERWEKTFRPKTEKEWEQDEAEELGVKRKPDLVSEWIGSALYFEDYTDISFRYSPRDIPLTVSRFYPHEKLIVDFVPSASELQKRKTLFELLEFKYMYIDFGEELGEAEFKARLNEIRRQHEEATCRRAGAI